MTLMRLRSPPWGYLVRSFWTRIRGWPFTAISMAAMASGLFPSMAMTPSALGKSRSMISMPSTIWFP